MPRGALYLAFACSGAAALIYETTWTRLLTLFMGHTVAAASTVLAAFMGGLALGAGIGGRLAPTLTRAAAIRAYAGIEVLIAMFALVLPYELSLLQPVVAAAYADGTGGTTYGVVRLACALIVVTIPAIAMGATLPLVVRWDVARASDAGHDTGMLYAVNTVGAALGAVLSGFVLLPALGMRMTTLVGVLLNIGAALLAWWLTRGSLPITDEPEIPQRRGRLTQPGGRLAQGSGRLQPAHGRLKAAPPIRDTAISQTIAAPKTAAIALAISGCVSLILQVAWTRILALTIGPTTFAFSAMVATFIAGIALGSFAGSWIVRRRPSAWVLAISLLVSALAATGAAAWAPRVPLFIADAVAAPYASFDTVVRLQSVLIAALMMPMTVAFGAAFPLAVALAAREDARVPSDVALVYTANTVGAIAGALLGGFVLVPRLGLQNTVRVAASLAVAGFVVVAIGHSRTRLAVARTGVVAMGALAGVFLLPSWDRELISSGAYKYAPYMANVHRDAMLRAGALLYYREGAAATVSVRKVTGSLSLAIDGKVDASNAGDMLTQRLLAHLPLLLHPAAVRVGIIGLGSGVTLGSALRHPIQRADMVEISPEVVEASSFFLHENHNALRDPRTRLIVGDGRSHLAFGREAFDVIISEPSNPWMAGVAALFTREFFEAAKRRLAPEGVLCQWAHTYDISDADLRSIVATFTSVFPHAALWLVGEGDVLLIGSTRPIEPRLANIRTGWAKAGVAADLADVDVHDPESLLSLFVADTARLKHYAGTAPVQRDDTMALEFSGPRGIYGGTTTSNARTLRSLAEDSHLPAAVRQARAVPATWARRGTMQLRAETYGAAWDDFARAVHWDPENAAALDGLVRAAAPAARIGETEGILRDLVRRNAHNAPAAVALSRLIAARGDFVAAAAPLEPLFNGPMPDIRALDQLASVFADAGDQPRLAAIVADLQRVAPDAESTLYYSASLHFMSGRLDDAASQAERLRALNPRHSRGLNLLGATYATLGRRDQAREAFEASLAADSRNPTAYANLGAFELEVGNAQAAADYFAEALTLDPSSTAAQQGLSSAVAALGR